jgi:hypothetical protein
MASEFKVVIRLGNEAMQTQEDVANVLEEIVSSLRQGRVSGSVFDDNGNNVGTWTF